MTQESDDDTSRETPPSFVPTHHSNHSSPSNHHSSQQRSGNSQELPSFAPRRSASQRSRGQESRSTAQAHGSTRSSNSRFVERSTSPHRYESSPQSWQPRRSGTPKASVNMSREGVNNTPRNSQASSSHLRRPQSTVNASASRRRSGNTRIKYNVKRIVSVLVIAMLLLLAVFGLGMWNWVNGQLTKKDMLTSMANTAAQTWLILGSDQRDGTTGTGTQADAPGFRTDTILVLTKPKSGSSSLISIPRDSLVQVNSTYMKINAVAEVSGYSALTGQVENITGQKIDHVAMIKFGGLEKVVNALGGVELCYSRTVNDTRSGLNWTSGCHVVNGSTALAFSRMRYSDPEGDFGRAKRQRQVIAAIVKKASSSSTLSSPSKIQKVAKASLASLVVDNKSNPYTLLKMALAFKAASGSNGVTGSVYWSNPDYYPNSSVGSTVLLDASRNTSLFASLANGTHAKGTVGGQV